MKGYTHTGLILFTKMLNLISLAICGKCCRIDEIWTKSTKLLCWLWKVLEKQKEYLCYKIINSWTCTYKTIQYIHIYTGHKLHQTMRIIKLHEFHGKSMRLASPVLNLISYKAMNSNIYVYQGQIYVGLVFYMAFTWSSYLYV